MARKMTDRLARSIAWDTANRQMNRDDRHCWNAADFALAAKTYNQLFPLQTRSVSMSHTTISHDAFARQSLVRRLVKTPPQTACACCGRIPTNRKLYNYGIQRDDKLSGEIQWDGTLVCGMECHRQLRH